MATDRYREIDLRRFNAAYWETFNSNGTLRSSTTAFTGFEDGTKNSIADCAHHGYRRRRQRGEIIMGDLSMTKRERHPTLIDFQYGPYPYWGGAWNKMRGDWIGTVESLGWACLPPLLSLGTVKDEVLFKAYAKMNQAKVLSGESLSDLGKTVSMLRRPLGGAQTLLKEIFKSRNARLRRKSMTLLRANSESWLEYRYGWQPLILDGSAIIDDITRKLSKGFKDARRLVVRAEKKQQLSVAGTFPWQSVPNYPSVQTSGGASVQMDINAFAGVMYEIAPRTDPEALAAYYGLRARDIPALVWEKIPYSFVADWFLNVGDYIEAKMEVPDIKVLSSWVTVTGTTDFNCHASGRFTVSTSATGTTTFEPSFGSAQTKTFTYTREANRQLASWPVVKAAPLSLLHLTDAAALSYKPIIGLLRELRH